ncbi:ABC transporter [Calocera cornea HHB12733]|uniref:ABC transporter n=1 Tax=Calocera cornea HHB12733 TaxID=1353952 RepID=A0A165JPQ6_9BASI|nr:ABC transporter [Calocera cornea HHB12733]
MSTADVRQGSSSPNEKTGHPNEARISDDGNLKKEDSPQSAVDAPAGNSGAFDVADDKRYLTGWKLFFAFTAMLLSIFLVALDQTITATAIPRIASDFNSLNDVTWIASGYFLTQAGFLMLYGQLLVIAPTKWVYITAITIFELGSLICGVAPNVNVLIFGRAFAGIGAAGIFVSILSIIAQITRLEDRPMLFGSFGAVFAVSSVIGPLLGGAFSDHVTWRWCFYINLPIGAISIGVIMLIIEARPAIGSDATDGMTQLQRWLYMDWIGALLSVAMVVTLLLPLQWGGNLKPWNDPSVIALFCVFGAVLAAFIAWEWRMGPRAVLPLALFRRRTQIGTCLEAFFVMLGMLLATYYLPLQYQAKGHSATQSGIDILPFMLAVVIFAAVSGGVISFTGRYWPFLFFSPFITAIGAGLLFTLDADAPNSKMIGYQILFGAGVGGALQNVVIAIQAEYHDNERMIPQATSLVTFAQLVGGVIGICIAGTIFSNQLTKELAIYAPTLPAEIAQAIKESVTVVQTLPADQQGPIVEAYVKALDYVYLIGVPGGVFGALCALLTRNHNIKALGIKMGASAA